MLWLRLDGDGPLHRQLYRPLRAAILDGRLAPGERLPSTRSLGREVGVSRNTVLRACEQVVAEGYAAARARSGTYVADALPAPSGPQRTRVSADSLPGATPQLSAMAARLGEIVAPGRATWSPFHELVPYDLRYGKPAYGDRPLEAWTRLLGRRARKLSVRRLAHQPPGGAPALREALAGYLRRARGVVCDASQIVIVHGSQQAIDLSTRLLLNPGDADAVVEPHYTGFSICLRAAGARLVDVPVDEQGMQGERLAGVAARLACVTPSHQYPTGAVVSLQRRARTRTAARRGTLLDAVGHALGDRARVRGASAGLHVRLELPGVPAHAACALREACRRRGVGVYPAARFYAKPPAHAELLLGYAALDQDAIREGVVRLAEAVERLDAW